MLTNLPNWAPVARFTEMTLIPAWIINTFHYKVWDKTTFPFPNFNGCTFHPTLCWTCDYLQRLKINHVSKGGHRQLNCTDDKWSVYFLTLCFHLTFRSLTKLQTIHEEIVVWSLPGYHFIYCTYFTRVKIINIRTWNTEGAMHTSQVISWVSPVACGFGPKLSTTSGRWASGLGR